MGKRSREEANGEHKKSKKARQAQSNGSGVTEKTPDSASVSDDFHDSESPSAKDSGIEVGGPQELNSDTKTSDRSLVQDDTDKASKKAARKAAKAERKAERHARKQAKKQDKAAQKLNGDIQTPQKLEVSGAQVEEYEEDFNLASKPQSEIDEFLSTNSITITDPSQTSLRPITDFAYLPASEKDSISLFPGFTAPTAIQAVAWPYLFARRDAVGVAETGSGKTLAFGLPCIRDMMATPEAERRRGIHAIVLSPTRELASQIHEQMVQIATPRGLRVCCVYGGVPKPPQQVEMRKANIVVATPGRLQDLIDDGSANLGAVKYLVLDEADRMLDQGFKDAIDRIIQTTLPTPQRQTLMFTATWPASIRDLASTYMTSPVKLDIGNRSGGELQANTRITQIVEVMQPTDKSARLLALLREHQSGAKKNDRILVFCLYKKEAARVEEFIRTRGRFTVAGIHGDMSQPKRTESLAAFKSGRVTVLVATDVAARGLDIPAVKLVLNHTFPLTAEDYVHRIGRTGRAGREGLAITFFTEHEKPLSGALINVLKGAGQEVPDALLKFGGTVKKKSHEAYGAFFKEIEPGKKATRITFD